MSYEKQRTVQDGDALVRDDTGENTSPTKGVLVHGSDRTDTARPVRVTNDGELAVDAQNTNILLHSILIELRMLNLMMKMVHEVDIDNVMVED